MKGCHFVLQIIYFKERYEGNSLNDPNAPPPWIQRWCGDNLKEKIRAENEDITGLIQRAKIRARRKKEERKRQEGKDKKQKEELDSLESESDEDSEEEEYQTTDSEPEPDVQRERRSKKKEDDSVIDTNPVQQHMDIPVQVAIIPEPEAEPEPIIDIGPHPWPESNIQGGPETIIEIGPEPPELLDGYMAECEWADKVYERKKEEADAEIKACDEAEVQYKSKRTTWMKNASESEIDLAIRRAVEGIVAEAREMEKQEREAAPTLNKIGQHAPGLMMVASVVIEAEEYDPNKAFDLRFTPQQPQREQQELAELYDLDDFPEEPENPVTPGVPALVNKITRDLKNRCVAWAFSKNDNKYNIIFEFNREWHLEVVRCLGVNSGQ
ncbi:hypothetical protein PIB30_034423 [Stylosanthes scabra]|uniref:Uncharacterized protein n=1 Tax=Stylosanthes scabra TaxID=79078 RepID=A0ABU6RDD3_9FABA|nr:hypothetical protein [Stylosanthes scabra]